MSLRKCLGLGAKVKFITFIEKNYYSEMYKTSGIKKEIKDWKYEDSKKGFVQYAIIETIKKNLLKRGLANDNNKILYTKNGKRWSTWWTFYVNDQYKLFVKIVRISGTYKIRLIEYSKENITIENKEKTLLNHIEICHNTKDQTKNLVLNTIQCKCKEKAYFKTKSGKLVRESEIANINLNNELTLIENTKIFSKFLEKFLDYKLNNNRCRQISST